MAKVNLRYLETQDGSCILPQKKFLVFDPIHRYAIAATS
jgi:hypothetical protein